MLRRLALALFAFAAAAPVADSLAQTSPPPRPGPTQAPPADPQKDAVGELLDLFAAFCLMKFPDDAAAETYGSARGFKPMPPERLRGLLGQDPGVGYLYETGQGTYAVTIERPPFHTCAIRKRFTRSPEMKGRYVTTLNLWAGTQRQGKLSELPTQHPTISGAPTVAYLWDLARSDGKGAEKFMLFITTAAGEEPEIRLVRALGNR